MRRIVGGAILALAMLAEAGAADLSQTGPLASSEAIMGARATRQDGFEFTVTPKGGAALTVDSSPDVQVVFQDPVSTITDYALKRVILLRDQDKVHATVNTSLYAPVALRAASARSWPGERAALIKSGTKDKSLLDPFWRECATQIPLGPSSLVRRAAKDGSVHFLHGGKDVASYALSRQTLTKDESLGLARFLRGNTALHPAIIADIQKSGRMPARIMYALAPSAKKPPVMLTFSAAQPVKAVYPLRKGETVVPLRPGASVYDTTMAALLPVMQAAQAGSAPGKKSLADYRTTIDAAVKAKQPFQAVIDTLEMSFQFGNAAIACADPAPADCHALKDLLADAADDPRVAALKAALAPTPQTMNQAIASLTAMKRDDLANAYVLDEFLANDLVAAGRPDDALPLFAAVLKDNPYAPVFYKNLGDLLRGRGRADLAWFCYDLGRQLPGGAAALSSVTDSEVKLEKDYPQFF
ncbi:MAG TPA: hypothetical protein VGG48_08395 [Rhizomicrobium sp.]|jgi:hypothetical protein